MISIQKLETRTHQGADQDVDTDEDNLKSGITQLHDELQKAIQDFQANPSCIVDINNLCIVDSKKKI